MKKFLIPLVVIALAVFVYVYKTNSTPSGSVVGETTVEMNGDGFIPEDITVKKGTKVVFKNIGTKAHWPASNLHPTHNIYPEFDPKEPVPAGGEWSFVFDERGEWKYHDHLWPASRGVVTVE